MTTSRNTELGHFLRSRREKLSPETFGLLRRPGRRTSGLRREEVAELAGISVDWYIRLEQGRDVSPSLVTIEALATALRLGDTERDHLRELTGKSKTRRFVRETVPWSVLSLVERLEYPAYVIGRRWDILAWNKATEELFGDFNTVAADDRNILIYFFLDQNSVKVFGNIWAQEARRVIAQFRLDYDLWAEDPAFQDLLHRLRQGSSVFSDLWEDHEIRPGTAGQKCLNHPDNGPTSFDYVTFQANDDPALKLVVYTPSAQRQELTPVADIPHQT